MPYTIGTSHGPFTGTGSFVIAKPAGIRTIVTNIPSWTGHENTSPLRYHRLGRFTLGNSHGFSESQLLEYAQQLVYPIPAIWELLAYDINDGASCTFYELVDVPDLTLKQPWDRTPSAVRANAGGTAVNVASTTAWSYTVPTARRLLVGHLEARLTRIALATTANEGYAWIECNGTNIVLATLAGGAAGVSNVDALSGGGWLILGPNETLVAKYVLPETTGSIQWNLNFTGTLFDA